MGLKSFLNGFLKKDYIVDLPSSFDEMPREIKSATIHAYEEITNTISYLPVTNVNFGIKNFVCNKLDDDYVSKLGEVTNPIYLIKQVCKEFKTARLYEFNFTVSIISKGLDNNIWRFDIESFFIMSCCTHEFDSHFTTLSLSLTDAFIQDHNLNKMLDSSYQINKLALCFFKTDKITSTHFDGYIKTYGDQEKLSSLPINDLFELRKYNSTSESMLESSLNEPLDFNKLVKENPLLIDVVRRTTKINP